MTHAALIGTLKGIPERSTIEARDYASQKISVAYLSIEQKGWDAVKCLTYICEAFGLEMPVSETEVTRPLTSKQ
jgi:hypothetical protein